MTGQPTIDYETLALEAMRGVVRTVLNRVVKTGLPGDHHFYISFATQGPGVVLSKRLKEKYPREMTIVLQHRFWDLVVSEDRFEVKLTFDGIPERLVVPFGAIKVFFDPSVRYGLQFEEPELGAETGEPAAGLTPNSGSPRPISARATAQRKPRSAKKPRNDRDVADDIAAAPVTTSPVSPPNTGAAAPVAEKVAESAATSDPNAPDAKPANGGAQILSLDQFRKK